MATRARNRLADGVRLRVDFLPIKVRRYLLSVLRGQLPQRVLRYG
jgi:hypothetical protein